jgi:predicted phosphodiesterase
MRYLVLSDIHSNIEALDACVRRAKNFGYDSVLCCGDIVGYGPNPSEVMDMLDELQTVSIRGNHDRVVAGLDEPTHFNTAARRAIDWTQENLSDAYCRRLALLPTGPLLVRSEAQLVHGSRRDEDEYVVTEEDALFNLALTSPSITFFGHTHEPGFFARDFRWQPTYGADGTAEVTLPSEKVLVNPGSVGQPRDGDPRASFLIWDTSTGDLEFHRAEYDFKATQAKMWIARLPEILIVRLALGR